MVALRHPSAPDKKCHDRHCAIADDCGFAFASSAIRGRKINAAFDGGRLTADSGVLWITQTELPLGIADPLAACIADPRIRAVRFG